MITYPTDKLQKVLLSGGCEQRNLPSGYTQVKYLETDGNSYIDTGVLLNNTDAFEITFQSSDASLASPVMGAISGGTAFTAENNICVTYNVINNINSYSVYCDGAAGDTNVAWNGGNYADKLKHTIKYKGLNIAPTIDGVAMTQITPTTLTTSNATVTTWLFGRNNTGSGSKAQDGVRIFDTNFYAKGHFIPCRRNSDNVLGMYDLVGQTFLTNQGTGTFTAGSDVVPSPDTPMDIVCNNGVIKLTPNLLDRSKETQGEYINKDTGNLDDTSSPWAVSDYIPVTAGSKITISGITFLSTMAGYNYYNSEKVLASTIFYETGTHTYTVPNNASYIRICYRYEPDDNVRINVGDSANSIYTDGTQEVVTDNLGNTANAERLLGIGSYKDTQEVLSGLVTHNTGIKVLDGTEDWIESSNVGKFNAQHLLDGADSRIIQNAICFCTHFLGVVPSTSIYYMEDLTCKAGWIDGSINFDSLYVAYAKYENDLVGFKQYLADQYNAGTPVIVVYPLAEPTTEQVTPQPLAGNSVTQTAGSIDNLPIESSTIAELKKRYIGDTEVKKVYIGDNLVWSAE